VSAYVIVDLEIIDPAGFEEYEKRVVPMAEQWGGNYIIAGSKLETLEGNWKPKRIVVVQFLSMEGAKEWLNCPEYREACKIRHRTAKTNMVLAEGM
jgi:uncharacterized protein (DUF1330 family)